MAEILALFAKFWPLIEQYLAMFSDPATRDQAADLVKRMQPLVAQALQVKAKYGSLKLTTALLASVKLSPAQLIANLELIVSDVEKASPAMAQLITDIITMLNGIPSLPAPSPTPPLPNPNPA